MEGKKRIEGGEGEMGEIGQFSITGRMIFHQNKQIISAVTNILSKAKSLPPNITRQEQIPEQRHRHQAFSR